MPDGGQLVVRTRGHGGDGGRLPDRHGLRDGRPDRQPDVRGVLHHQAGRLGLGLPTTAKIIEAHGGTISVQSELGRGTQFTIELPAVARLAKGTSAEDKRT